jgi:hypothetical protein
LNCSLKHKALLVHNPVTLAFFQIRDTNLRNAISDKTLGGFRQTIGPILLIWYWTRPIFVLDQNILCHNYEEPNIAGSNLATYEVWQKSNATDFLLTMNFILFTNQGYSLQNSSLGQLHSDGGVVSIVRSSAGRLLLE